MKKLLKCINNESGITLIALVITIIVLLILVGVTIITLTGDNGLLQKAGEAKQTNEIAAALEKIQVEVAGSYGLDGKIDIEELNTNLNCVNELKYRDNEIVLEGDNKNKIEKLPAMVKLNDYKFIILKNGNVVDINTYVNNVNAKIGTEVNGYTAQNLNWQLFYADEDETFLISKTVVKEGYTIPTIRTKYNEEEMEYEYKGSEDVRNSSFGLKWNKKWLDKCINPESTRNNAKKIAYLCDSINWKEYATEGVANYAVGGPTVELLIESWNKSQGTNIELSNNDIFSEGIIWNKPSELYTSNPFKDNIQNGVYHSDVPYYLSTPGCYGCDIRYVVYSCVGWYTNRSDAGIRPIVSIPTSKISVDGDTVTVNP